MKYLVELLNRKKYKAVVACMIIGLIGAIIVYFPILNIILNGFPKTYETIFPTIASFIFGIAIIYCGMFYIPSVNAFIQNKEDYDIEYLEDGVQIKYKHYRFMLKYESTIGMSTFDGKDADGNIVSGRLSSQIYSGLVHYFPRFRFKVFPENADILERDEIEKSVNFGLREATDEEVQAYIKCKHFLSEWIPFVSLTISTILLLGVAFLEGSTGMENIKIIIFCLMLPMAMLGIFSLFKVISEIGEEKRIKKSKIYIGDCYIYDRGIPYGGSEHYYVDVKTDTGDYIRKSARVSKKIFDDCEDKKDKKYRLIAIRYKNDTEYDVQLIEEMEMYEKEIIDKK